MERLRWILGAVFIFLTTACNTRTSSEWQLEWEDNFDQTAGFDTTTWSKIPRWTPDWANYMSDNDACYDMADGNLILRGIVNPDLTTDTATYLTGGLYTKYKRAFHGGRIEVKAKMYGARGAWPAIWLKPFEEAKFPWPTGGEIDIMEHLNSDTIVYQTVHSTFTQTLGFRDNPPSGTTAPIDSDDYNVYAVEMYPDSLVFFINDERIFMYPKIETDKEGQFPFDKPYYLLIDMQLGGKWVGHVYPEDLPVEMKIDWVRYYKKRE